MALNASLIILIVAILVARYRRDFLSGFCASIFVLVSLPPNLSIEISLAMPSITIHRIIVVITFFFWLNNKDIRFKTFYKTPIWLVLNLLVCSMGISLLLSDVFLLAVKQYMFFIGESYLFFIMYVTSVNNVDQINRTIKYAAAGLLLAAIIGIVQRYTGFNITDIFGTKLSYDYGVPDRGNTGDVVSTYAHRILFGIGCATGLLYQLYLQGDVTSRGNIFWRYLSILIMGAALYFSNSRGPWLGFVLAYGFVVLMNPRWFLKKGILLFFIVGIVFALRPGTYETIEGLFSSTVDPTTVKGSSYRWRFSVIQVAVEKTLNADLPHVLFGFGQGAHLTTDPVLVETSTGYFIEMLSWDSEFAVNLFEYGVIGMALIIYLYGKLSLMSMMYIIHHPRDRFMISTVFGIIILVMFMKTNVRFFSTQLGYLEYMNIAILCLLLGRNQLLESTADGNAVDGWRPERLV